MRLANQNNTILQERFFHVLFILIVFLFYSFDREHPLLELNEIVFFLNYACAAFIINFFLFPKFIYKKKYGYFALYVTILLGCVIVIEELVLEKIFFKDTRGGNFSNIIFTLIDILPPIIVLSGFKIAWDAVARQKEVDELKLMVQESELEFLKTQINPHFLFNNLNNLYVYAIENSPKTPEIILALSSILRYMLYECKVAYVPLNKETEQLQNFVELGELQIEGRGSVLLNNEIVQNSYKIAPLILIVFIENAFKHSASSLTEDILIEIGLKINPEGKLIFSCKNSFQDQSNTQNLSHGIGLKNVRKRLDLIYPNAHKLNIITSDDFYTVELELELNS